jgi:hypothetical protein
MAMILGGLVLFLGFFVFLPVLTILIGYAAWKGKPETWDRSMYWTAFGFSVIGSSFALVFAQRMNADVRTWQYFIQLALFLLGSLLFGVAGGCMVGVFAYRRGDKRRPSE